MNGFVSVFGQTNKYSSLTWIELFKRDSSTLIIEKDSLKCENYFIEVNPNENNFFANHANYTILRQLGNRSYIVKAPYYLLQLDRKRLKYLIPVNNKWKLSPQLIKGSLSPQPTKYAAFNIKVSDFLTFDSFALAHKDQITLEKKVESLNIIRISCSFDFVFSILVNLEVITYIESAGRTIHLESPIIDFDNSVNTINLTHAEYPLINGVGLTVSIKEDKYNDQDIDLSGRSVSTNISSNNISQHATEMATLIGGAGNSFFSGKGAVPKVFLSSADNSNLEPDLDAYGRYNISVQNHSYGVGIENFYGADAAAYDNSMFAYPALLHIFSSGNSGDQAPVDGLYAGLSGVANLTGSFKMAKNIITVGSIDVLGKVAPLSSKGPAYDGRVKPELVAYGESGSSEASAITSGTAILVQNAFSETHNGKLPENALVKAILINSAKDVDAPGIDFSSGYGSVDAFRSVQNILWQKYFSGTLAQGQDKTFLLNIPDSTRNLKVTLVWNDPPSSPNAFRSLVNDLDLTMENNLTGEKWLPWVLNSFPDFDSLRQLPHRGRDSINVVEQISVATPFPGQYTIHVSGKKIVFGDQSFYVSYQWDTLDHFKWTYPTSIDFMGQQGSNTFRWDGIYSGNPIGKLEYSCDNGGTWKLIDSEVNVNNHFYPWTPPDTFSMALAKMTVCGKTYISDIFSFSSPMQLQVDFDCADSLMLNWNRVKGINQYRMYSLISNDLKPVDYTNDTSIILSKQSGYPYYAVTAVLTNNVEGVKSYTINVPDLGAACYITIFDAYLQGDTSVNLTLKLMSIYNIKHIYFEKKTSFGWVMLKNDSLINAMTFLCTDLQPILGVNIYRARIEFENGSNITSVPQTIYYLGANYIIVAPNPTKANEHFKVISKVTYGFTLSITDIVGHILYENKFPKQIETISNPNWAQGIYIITLRGNSGKIYSSKFIVN